MCPKTLPRNGRKSLILTILLLIVQGLLEKCVCVNILTCNPGNADFMASPNNAAKTPNMNVGAVTRNIHLRVLEEFTTCVRFEFHKLYADNVVLSITGTESRPMLQIRANVEFLRIVLAQENQYVFLEEWITPNRWQHVCVVNHPSTPPSADIYLNGKQIGNIHRNLTFEKPLIGENLTLCFLNTSTPSELKFVGNITQVNIWKKELSGNEVKELADCKINNQGDVVSWDKQEWTYVNTELHSAEIYTFCESQNKRYFNILKPMKFDEGRYLCEGIGGRLYTPDTHDKVESLFQEVKEKCTEFWAGLAKTNNGDWKNYFDGTVSKNYPWAFDEPNGLNFENCAGLEAAALVDEDCELERCPICFMSSENHLKLLGSCEKRNYDMNFFKEDTDDGFYFRGYGFYSIRLINDSWVWMDQKSSKGDIVATLEPSKYNYPFGRQTWTLHRSMCNQHEGIRTLLLTSCEKNQFTCNDGTCIPQEKRCDLDYDCQDTSDENDCVLIRYPFDYKKQVVPRGVGDDESAEEVMVFLDIEALYVDTNKMELRTSFNLTMSWLEKRVMYINLKHNLISNLVQATSSDLWVPSIYFVNTLNHDTTVDDELTDTFVIRQRSENVYEKDVPEKNELFSGAKNPILSWRRYHSIFTCEFDLTWYPFDSQSCSMNFLMNSGPYQVIHFANKSRAQYTGSALLLEYKVGQLSLKPYMEGEFEGIKVILHLRRRHSYYLIHTYLPMLTLLVIAYLTLFFQGDEAFDTKIMASLTTLLVMSTLFTQFTGLLPKTPYFKMIDIWLLFCIFATFFIIVFHVLVHYLTYLKSKSRVHGRILPSAKSLSGNSEEQNPTTKFNNLLETENEAPSKPFSPFDVTRNNESQKLGECKNNISLWIPKMKSFESDPVIVEEIGKWLLGIGLLFFIMIYAIIAATYITDNNIF